MGYYGLGPGDNSRMPDQLTPLERALRGLPLELALDALVLLEKIMRNILRQPAEEKLRRLSTNNEKLSPILGNEAGLNILREIGWQLDGDLVFLPQSIKLEFQQHVGKIIDSRDFYIKEIERVRKSAKRERDLPKTEAECATASTPKLVREPQPEPTELQPSACSPDTSVSANVSGSLPPFEPQPSIASTQVSQPVLPGIGLSSIADAPCAEEAGRGVSNSFIPPRRQPAVPGAAAVGAAAEEAGDMLCPQGHPLCHAKLKPYQGFIHRRECSLCSTVMPRESGWLRCEQCRLSICAVGRSRDTYCICMACLQATLAAHVQRMENDEGPQRDEAPPQTLDPGMSASLKALRQKRCQQSAANR